MSVDGSSTGGRSGAQRLAAPDGGIRQKLRRSHLNVAFIGLGMLVVGGAATAWLRASALRLAVERGPIVAASMQALSGVQRSSAELSGWLASGDELFRKRRAAAWKNHIRPAEQNLAAVSKISADIAPERIDQLRTLLKRLEALQNRIETVAQTPENQPASVLVADKLAPLVARIYSTLSAIESAPAVGADRVGQLAAHAIFSDLHGALALGELLMRGYVENGDGDAADEARRRFRWAQDQVNTLAERSEWITPDQREQLTRIRADLEACDPLIDQTVALRSGPGWNVANNLMLTEAGPLARQVTSFLHGISEGELALMSVDAGMVDRMSSIGFGLLIVPLLGMAGVAFAVSRRSADQLTQPIIALVEAAHELGAGRLTTDIPVTTNDEIGLLTATFNEMRAALAERTRQVAEATASIRETTLHVAAATGRIVHLAQKLSKGAVKQADDATRVQTASTAVLGLGEQGVKRARALAQSAQWGEAIGKVGHKTVEASVFAMGRLQEEVETGAHGLAKLADQIRRVGELADALGEHAMRRHVDTSHAAAAGRPESSSETTAEQVTDGSRRIREILVEMQRTQTTAAKTMEAAATVVTASSRVAKRAADTIKTLVEITVEVNAYSADAVAAAGRQAADIGDVHNAIVQISEVTQANVASTHQFEQVAENLHALCEKLRALLAEHDGVA